MTQLETAVEVIKDRSTEAVEAIQHGVEALGTRLGVIEPPRARRRFRPWMAVALVAAVLVIVAAVRRRQRISPVTKTEREPAAKETFASASR